MKKLQPRNYSEAIKHGFRVCKENFTGNLNRSGTITLERIDKATGDREVVKVPFTARLVVKQPTRYRIYRHAHLTPNEARDFEERANAGTKPADTQQTPSPLEMLVGTDQYRAGRQDDFDDGMDELHELLKSAAALLWHHGEKINNGEKVSFNLPWGLSETLSEQAESVKGLQEIAKYLRKPPKTVVPKTQIKFPADHPLTSAQNA